MGDLERRRKLPAENIEPMIRVIEPHWDLEEAIFMEDGITAIYRLTVKTNEGMRECFLKATPLVDEPDRGCVIQTEARLMEIVRTNTEIPVPSVIGAVDTHESLRAPYFLMDSMDGAVNSPSVIQDLSPETIRELARQTGHYLGQLHELPAENITTFGKGISHDSGTILHGGQPSGDPSNLVFSEGNPDWRELIREWIETGLKDLSDTKRFSDLVNPIRDTLFEVLPKLPDSPSPVIARMDHGLWNVLTDQACREITGVIDWGSLFAVPPAYDLAYIEWVLAGGPWLGLNDVPDQRELIREGLLDGYRKFRPIPAEYKLQRQYYQLEIAVTSLVAVENAQDSDRVFSHTRVDEAENGLREIVPDLLAF